jgi:hypothetical protein
LSGSTLRSDKLKGILAKTNKMLDFLIQQTYRPMYTEERPVQSLVREARIVRELSMALETLFPIP